MTAKIIDLSATFAMETRHNLARQRAKPPINRLARLFHEEPFGGRPEQVAAIRAGVEYLISLRNRDALAAARDTIEEFIALPCLDEDARFCRDSLALGLCARLQVAFAGFETIDFFDAVIERLFPLPAAPKPKPYA